MAKNLRWCANCKENSVVRKIYSKKDNSINRIEYCINHACGYKLLLPFDSTMLGVKS